jgi:hypothetical protein
MGRTRRKALPEEGGGICMKKSTHPGRGWSYMHERRTLSPEEGEVV